MAPAFTAATTPAKDRADQADDQEERDDPEDEPKEPDAPVATVPAGHDRHWLAAVDSGLNCHVHADVDTDLVQAITKPGQKQDHQHSRDDPSACSCYPFPNTSFVSSGYLPGTERGSSRNALKLCRTDGVDEENVVAARGLGGSPARARDRGARMSTRFPMRLGRKSRPLLLLWGARPSNSYVDVNDELDAHFGLFRLRTPLSNIARWSAEGPWLWVTSIGVRRGIRDGEISFDGTHTGGVRLEFKQSPRWGLLHPPALWVTVEDIAGFTAALGVRGIPGEDRRKKGSQ